MKKIKTFGDACVACGTTEKEFNNKFANLGLPKDTIAYEKIKVIVKALNGEWVPNWKDSNEYKYYPYFRMSPFGFGAVGCDRWGTVSLAGSRLCFKNRELAEYAGKQFEDIYKNFIV